MKNILFGIFFLLVLMACTSSPNNDSSSTDQDLSVDNNTSELSQKLSMGTDKIDLETYRDGYTEYSISENGELNQLYLHVQDLSFKQVIIENNQIIALSGKMEEPTSITSLYNNSGLEIVDLQGYNTLYSFTYSDEYIYTTDWSDNLALNEKQLYIAKEDENQLHLVPVKYVDNLLEIYNSSLDTSIDKNALIFTKE